MNTITNRLETSSLITINLEDFYPSDSEIISFDLKSVLHKELILIEKQIRLFIKTNDWSVFANKLVYVYSSNEAIIPLWSKLLICGALNPYAKLCILGSKNTLISEYLKLCIDQNLTPENYKNKKLIIKGCNNKDIDEYVYVYAYQKLLPVASSIMYGEACSSVPLFKKKKV